MTAQYVQSIFKGKSEISLKDLPLKKEIVKTQPLLFLNFLQNIFVIRGIKHINGISHEIIFSANFSNNIF